MTSSGLTVIPMFQNDTNTSCCSRQNLNDSGVQECQTILIDVVNRHKLEQRNAHCPTRFATIQHDYWSTLPWPVMTRTDPVTLMESMLGILVEVIQGLLKPLSAEFGRFLVLQRLLRCVLRNKQTLSLRMVVQLP